MKRIIPKNPPLRHTQSLNSYSPLFVVAGDPYAHDRSVGLDLIDIATFDPYVLDGRHGSRLNDSGRRDHRRSDHRRRRNHGGSSDNHRPRIHKRVHKDAAHNAADEAGPEVPSATPPSVAMAVTVANDRRPAVAKMATRTEMAARTETRMRKPAKSDCCHKSCYQYFLVHVFFLSDAFCVTNIVRQRTFRFLTYFFTRSREAPKESTPGLSGGPLHEGQSSGK